MKIIQELQVEPNDIQIRINETINLQQTKEEVYVTSQVSKDKIKKVFDKKTKVDDFTQVIKFLDGIQEEKTNASMENLTSYGRSLMSFMVTREPMHFS